MALLVGEYDIRLGYWKGQRKWGVNTLKSQSHQYHKMVTKKPHKVYIGSAIRGRECYLTFFHFSILDLLFVVV